MTSLVDNDTGICIRLPSGDGECYNAPGRLTPAPEIGSKVTIVVADLRGEPSLPVNGTRVVWVSPPEG